MASQTQGIQHLLAAEKKAAEKVSEARRKKANRLKAAKKEADYEINNYKAEREKQYREYEAKILGSKGDMETKIEVSTRQKIQELQSNVAHHKEEALSMLLGIVLDIKPELHENLRL